MSVIYSFVRARQLEGTLREPPSLGIWPISGLRVYKGWGFVPDSDWPDALPGHWPPLEPPGLDEKAKTLRTSFYQRCSTLTECRVALSRGIPVMAAFEITEDWKEPPGGVIPLPRQGEAIAATHSVTLERYDDDRCLFRFKNCWPNWGEDGYGYLPYQYLEKRLIDAFVMWFGRPPIDTSGHKGLKVLVWGAHSLVGEEVLHAVEIYDTTSDEMIAWTFAVERSDCLEVEELFVRPQFRRRGCGRKLLQELLDLSGRRHRPLKFSVTFADIANENRTTFARLLKKIGYKLVTGRSRLIPYEGIPARPKEAFKVPPLPSHIPSRPAAAPSFVRAGTVAVSFFGLAALNVQAEFIEQAKRPDKNGVRSVFAAEDNDLPSVSVVNLPVNQATKSDIISASRMVEGENKQRSIGKELVIGSAEYDRKNERRMELIQKKVRGALTADEEAEFERLQTEILQVTKRAFPHPPVDSANWRRLREGAREKPDTPD